MHREKSETSLDHFRWRAFALKQRKYEEAGPTISHFLSQLRSASALLTTPDLEEVA